MEAEILHNIAAIPSVTGAAFASALPLELEHRNGVPVSAEGKPPVCRIPPNRRIKQISPGLFAAVGTRLIAGRDFTWDDLLSQRRVAIVSENMARENWGEPRDALGKRIRRGADGPWSVVVGIAENVYDDGVDRQPPELVYFPGVRRGIAFAIRSGRAGTENLLKEIRAKIRAVNPRLPLAQVRTLSELYSFTMARRSFALVLLGIVAAMAVTLSIYRRLWHSCVCRCTTPQRDKHPSRGRRRTPDNQSTVSAAGPDTDVHGRRDRIRFSARTVPLDGYVTFWRQAI